MKRRDLERRLRRLGWHLARHGGKHDVWARGERELAVPRHAEINEYTARAILRQARGERQMRFAGRVFKAGRHWAVEVPLLDVVSQGRTRKDALAMIADAIEALANRPGFHVEVFPGTGEYFEVGSPDPAALTALLLRRARQRSGLSLAEVAARLGSSSVNAYARYEQGRSTPSVQKLMELFAAVSPERDLVLVESEA